MESHDKSKSDNKKLEAAVLRCDIAIIGGGIAGVACAERLAREARRQNKKLRIVVIEREPKIGVGASSGLEGWYHTGALYAADKNLSSMIHCLNALEDMYNWYHKDPKFKFSAHCNFEDLGNKNHQPKYSFADNLRDKWFVGEIGYLLPYYVPKESNSDTHPAAADTAWKNRAAQAKLLVTQMLYTSEWESPKFKGWCEAPHIGSDDLISEVDMYDHLVLFREFLDEKLGTGSSVRNEAEDEHKALEKRLEVPKKMDGDDKDTNVVLDVMTSRDAVVSTEIVLRDLVHAAIENGVRFFTSYELLKESLTVSEATGLVNGVMVRNLNNEGLMHIHADQYVFALGLGFDPDDFMRLHIPARVNKSLSVMAVSTPGYSTDSFVRMDPDADNHFNHVHHPGTAGIPNGYSIIADSNRVPNDNRPDDYCESRAMKLLKAAEKIYPPDGARRTLAWYGCYKTEITSLINKNYSWMIEPRIDKILVDPWWTIERRKQWEAHKKILDEVTDICRNPEQRKEIAKVAEDIDKDSKKEILWMKAIKDGWALNKHLHFAVHQVVALEESREAVETFNVLRSLAIAAFKRQLRVTEQETPNYLCVVPGKFSHFPSIAHNVYLEMEGRKVFAKASEDDGGIALAIKRQKKIIEEVTALVAEPKAESALKKAMKLHL